MSDDTRTRPTDDAATIRVFGGMGIHTPDGPASVGGPRQRRLLALLALRAGSGASHDWLAEHLWTDADRPDNPAPALRTYVSRLRQVLPEPAQGWLTTEPAGYRFDVPDQALEHRRFALLRAEAAEARVDGDPLAAHQRLDEALKLWRGAPFEEIGDIAIASADIAQLELDRLEMLEERWECALALGRHTQITGELAVFTSEHRHRDRAARQHALALHRSGRTPEALRVISGHREFIAEASGMDPSAEMVELEQKILAGDPSLNVQQVGRPLRGYQLLDEIGSGAFSIVWRAMQPSVGREVAIKQIRAELASQPAFIRRFEAEAHLVARIEHPHVVPLIDFWRDPDSAYLVMGLLRGGTLERRLDDGPLSVDQTLAMATEIGGALAAAHHRGIVHRDVKTGNIFFDEAGHAFLGDFGIALEATKSAGPDAAFSTGSPAYSAPEQIRREALGPQADVFSLGVVLFESLTGTLPFADSSSLPELIERQLTATYPLVGDLRPEIPAHVAAAVATATAKDAADRYPTVEDFVAALNAGPLPNQRQKSLVGGATDLPNPYMGLRAFDEADEDGFFGREGLVRSLTSRFEGTGVSSRCVGVVGPSGSGKSSVVRAGLSPAIRRGVVPGSEQWLATTMVPGANPYESLEAALLRIAVNPPSSLLEQLKDGRRGVLRCLRRCLGDDSHKVYLVIDQFEEIFTSADEADASAFLDALSVAVEDPQSPLRLVFTLRADYYHRPLAHATFAHVLDATSVNVTPLSADELERAMVEPAERLGVTFEPGLVALIVADCIGQPAPLPLLQYALTELFDRRDDHQLTIAAYDAMGRLSGALASRAEAIHDQGDDGQRTAIRRTFGAMTSPTAETADLRRRVAIADLGDAAGSEWVLDQFGDARLLTFDRDPSTREPTVEVSHEALLREWPRLAAWLAEDAELLRSLDAVSLAATNWDNSGRLDTDLYRGARLDTARGLHMAAPDRLRPLDAEFIDASQRFADAEHRTEVRRIRRLRRLVVGVAAALVLALVAGGVALQQQRRASEQADRAETEARNAETQADIAETEARNAETQAGIAETEARNAETQAQAAELATLISTSAAQAADNPEVALLLALEAHRRSPSAVTERAVLNAIGSSSIPNRISSLPLKLREEEACDLVQASSSGLSALGLFEGSLASRDSLTGEIVLHGAPPPNAPPCLMWDIDPATGHRLVVDPAGLAMWAGPSEGVWDVELQFDPPRFKAADFAASGHVLFASFPDGRPAMQLVDVTTGEDVGAPIVGGDELIDTTVSPDGSLVAISFVLRDGPPGGLTVVVDSQTGEEVVRLVTQLPLKRVRFDLSAAELVAAGFDDAITTFDLQTGEIIATTSNRAASEIVDMAIRPDGLLTVVAGGQVEIVDRRSGPIGDITELQNVIQAIVRPDGLITTLTTGNRLDTFDLDGSALITESHEIDAFAVSHFTPGWLGAVVFPFGDPTIINLATGDRSSVPLVSPEGERLAPMSVYADSTGLWAIDIDNQVVRWEDGDVVAAIDLDGRHGFDLRAGRLGDRLAVISTYEDRDSEVHLVDLASGEPQLVFSVPARAVRAAHPTAEGGLLMLDQAGILRTVDASGQVQTEVEIEVGIAFPNAIAIDETTGTLVIGDETGAYIVDPTTGDTRRMAQSGNVSNLGFARDGEMLVVTGRDGNIRIWEIDGNTTPAFVWDGSGNGLGSSPSWYDETTDAIWVVSSGKVLQIPLDPDEWIERACEIVGRDLTQEEWDRLVPGDEPPVGACA